MPLLVALFLLPLLELLVLAAIAPYLGFWRTIGLLATSFVLGVLMVIWQGREALARWRQALAEGRLALDAASDGLLICLAGLLLILPGVVSDGIAFLLLIPWTRAWIKSGWAALFPGHLHTETLYRGPEGTFYERTDDDGVIESYVVRREEAIDAAPQAEPPPITYLDETNHEG